MAHPYVIVDQAVRYFIHQWQCGLQPYLSFETLPNGAVCASTAIYSLPSTSLNQNEQKFQHRSGHFSRLRRRKKRKQDSNRTRTSSSNDQQDHSNVSDANDDHTSPTSTDLPSNSDTSFSLSKTLPLSIETFNIETQNDDIDLSHGPGEIQLPKQLPIQCIRHEDGCPNLIYSYFNEYTAICDSCSRHLEEKLKSTPHSHFLCPCCHNPNGGEPLSFCNECIEDLHADGWIETGRGSWHLDRNNGKVVCISFEFI